MVKKNTRRPRIFRGNIPANGTLIASNDEWAVYRMATKAHWMNVKLVSLGPRPRKANFWIGWNTSTRKLANKHDAKQLAHYPQLHDWLVGVLNGTT